MFLSPLDATVQVAEMLRQHLSLLDSKKGNGNKKAGIFMKEVEGLKSSD